MTVAALIRMRGWTTAAILLMSSIGGAEDRVKTARETRLAAVKKLFADAKVSYPPGEVYLRAFKHEDELELWAGARGKPLTLVKTYRVCSKSGELGPKRQEGDLQVPEGFYVIDRFNPRSNFHLSLGVSYPNEADRALGVKGALGGDIMIHGSCVTIGCIPIQDEFIEELYLATWDARQSGQGAIRVDIFPAKLDGPGMELLRGKNPSLLPFWSQLQPGFQHFEQTRRPAKFTVDPRTGEYRFPSLQARVP